MKLTPSKRRFYRQGMRAATLPTVYLLGLESHPPQLQITTFYRIEFSIDLFGKHTLTCCATSYSLRIASSGYAGMPEM